MTISSTGTRIAPSCLRGPRALALLALVAPLSASVGAAIVTPETSQAFARYARLTEQRIDSEVSRPTGFLWIDTLPAERRTEVTSGRSREASS